MNNYNKIKELIKEIRQELANQEKPEILPYLEQIEELTTEEPEEEKKLYFELGISDDKENDNQRSKKKVIQELKRLAELKQIEVDFKTLLEKKDKQGNFYPELVFWNFTYELALMDIGGGETAKTPSFWTNFDKELEWVKQNVSSEYFQELENLTVPSLFPTEKLDISKMLVIDLEKGDINKDFSVNSSIVDKAWQIVKEKALELGTRATIDYSNNIYTITINYASDNPNKDELEKLMTETPLKLENELLKTEKEQLPSTENFEKLKKQIEFLEDYVQGEKSEGEYKEIKEKIDKIK